MCGATASTATVVGVVEVLVVVVCTRVEFVGFREVRVDDLAHTGFALSLRGVRAQVQRAYGVRTMRR